MNALRFLLTLCMIGCAGAGAVKVTTTELPEKPSYEEEIYGFDAPEKYFEKGNTFLEQEKPQHAVDAFSQMVEKYPQYEKNVEARLAIARIYSDVYRDYEKAVNLYSEVIKMHPEEPEIFKACFMLGFIHANYLNDVDTAESYYNLFLEQFPDHELAPSVKFELENLGKSTDEFFITTEDDSVKTENNEADGSR